MCPLLNLSQFLLSHLMAMSLYIFSWTCRSVLLSASSGLDKVFCRGCVFLLGYLISFCLGIMNNFYALIHRYILVSTLWYVEDSPYYECLFLVINHVFALLIVHFSVVCPCRWCTLIIMHVVGDIWSWKTHSNKTPIYGINKPTYGINNPYIQG